MEADKVVYHKTDSPNHCVLDTVSTRHNILRAECLPSGQNKVYFTVVSVIHLKLFVKMKRMWKEIHLRLEGVRTHIKELIFRQIC